MATLSILYVEDKADLRDTISEMLEGDGREIVAMPDGESALAAWQVRHFDVLVTDISLPGISGTDLARQILRAKPKQWIVFCSGHDYGTALSALGPNVRSVPKAFEFDQMDVLMDEITQSLRGMVLK